jgi:23S rRNA (cytidine1920-2'-O)/16S rRNA (cytidine1409-2'-O)-methyltransferase
VAGRRRLDAELVRRGLASGRDAARRLIDDGVVLVNGSPATKPASQVHPADAIMLAADPDRYVGRGGTKLEAAIEAFAIDVTGRRCIDVGASTGGFTDCLLQHGAAAVIAVDVGTAQLHERLRSDERVTSLEQCDVRHFDPGPWGGPAPLVVCDVSFISLRTVFGALSALVADAGDLVTLVKPQFEVGKAAVSRGRGVITDSVLWREALDGVVAEAARNGFGVHGAIRSPVTGGSGNVEFLVRFRRGEPTRGCNIADLCRSDAIA